MASLNKCTIIGFCGKDPEIRYVMDNVPVASFSVATTESYKDKNGEWQESTDWHSIVAWRNQAEKVEKYVKKGTQVYIEGKLKTRSYDDKDGNKRYVTEIVADNLFTLGAKPDKPQYNYNPPVEKEKDESSYAALPEDDQLPF